VRTDGSVWCWGRADLGGTGGEFPETEHIAKVELGQPAR
jgi:hypothetical protein